MTIMMIVRQALQNRALTRIQERQIEELLESGSYGTADMAALETLVESLQAGAVVADSGLNALGLDAAA